MMKKTFKQLLGLTLSAAMIIGMTGCGNDTPTNNTETQVVSKETETTQTKESETQVVENEEITYPLDSDETITIWSDKLVLNADYTDAADSPFHSGLSEKVGVNFEFSFPMAGQKEQEAYNLLMTEDVLPDVIHKSITKGQLTELYNDGVIYDLTEYIPTYAPDYWARINEDEALKENVYTEDGRIFAIYSIAEEGFSTSMGPMIRKDWLDECGLDAPVTLEDWETVLTAFKEKHNATLAFNAKSTFNNPFFASGAGAYGTFQCKYYIDDNGKIQNHALQPEWAEYMKVLNRWYEAGLLDNDTMTMDTASTRTKAANNQIGASYGYFSQLTNFVADAEATGSGAEWVAVGYPRVAEGEPTCWIPGTGARTGTVGGFITTSCSEEKLITVLKALNYGYTEEGIMYWNFGEEGVTYTLNSEGQPEWTDLVVNDPQGLNGAATKYTGASTSPLCVQTLRFAQMKNVQQVADAMVIWTENTSSYEHTMPSVTLTEEETLGFTDKHTACSTYISEMAQKFIMGTESLDKIDEFYAQLKKMGIEECVAIQQAAYDRAVAK